MTDPVMREQSETTASLAAAAEGSAQDGIVSFRADVPEGLLASMQAFIERHPNWDQYRLVQAALAGFLVQNGSGSRDVTRCYLANLFPGQRSFNAEMSARSAAAQTPGDRPL